MQFLHILFLLLVFFYFMFFKFKPCNLQILYNDKKSSPFLLKISRCPVKYFNLLCTIYLFIKCLNAAF